MRVVLRTPIASDLADYRNSLTIGREYEVIGLSTPFFRLVDDHGEPTLYESQCFELIDPKEPAFWITELDGDCRYADPPGWSVPGFYEAWHDKNALVRRIFTAQLEYWFPEVAKISLGRRRV